MSKRDQTPTGNHYAMKALKDRRAALAGEIQSLKNKLEWAKKQLAHVDACLTMFQPGFDPKSAGIRRPRVRVKLYAQGDLSRMVLDALRRAGKPITCQDVTTALLAANGHPEEARPSLSRRVHGALAYQVRCGLVVCEGTGRGTIWALT
jgi:hypothetical protein